MWGDWQGVFWKEERGLTLHTTGSETRHIWNQMLPISRGKGVGQVATQVIQENNNSAHLSRSPGQGLCCFIHIIFSSLIATLWKRYHYLPVTDKEIKLREAAEQGFTVQQDLSLCLTTAVDSFLVWRVVREQDGKTDLTHQPTVLTPQQALRWGFKRGPTTSHPLGCL